jgi:hypothetical protein
MSYGKKYTLQAISKSGLTYTAEIWEKGYSGTTYSVGTGPSPFVLDCLATGDDPFSPILATTLTIRADFTDFTGPLPDFLTTDDKKYYVKLFAQGTTYFVWQGFIFMDTLQVPFTTGRNFIDIICVDGLAILKSTPYPFTASQINEGESILRILKNCFDSIQFPETYYINSCVNYYAQFQTTTVSHIRNSYILPNVWMNNDYSFKSCYEVLETIATAYGAQIFQSGGEWWMASVNERAGDTLRVFRTDSSIASDTLLSVSINRTYKPWQNDTTTPFYFINNDQNKTISKGYQSIVLTGDIDYAGNTIMNGNMSIITSGVPDFFTRTIGSGGSFVMNSNSGIAGATLISGTGNTDLQADSCGDVGTGDILEIGYQIKAAVTGKMLVEIKLDTGSTVYYYQKTVSGTAWSTSAFYEDDVNTTNMETKTITTLPCPANGFLTIKFRVSNGGINEAFIANIKKTARPSLTEKRVVNNNTSSNQYKKEVSTKIGLPFPKNSTTQAQTLLNLNLGGSALENFQRFGGSDTYATLGNLLYSQLFNILSLPQVNMAFNSYNLFNQSGNYIIGLLHNFGVQDPSSLVNVNSARFVMSTCTIDYINNTLSGTAMQVSNAVLTYTQIDTPTATPTATCKQYTNLTGSNWTGSYIRCDGIAFGPVTLLPGQSVCARIYTPITISGSNLTMGIDCV